MVLWSVEVIHFTNDFPLGVGAGPLTAVVDLSAYVVMLGLP